MRTLVVAVAASLIACSAVAPAQRGDSVLVQVRLVDREHHAVLASPRLVARDGATARIVVSELDFAVTPMLLGEDVRLDLHATHAGVSTTASRVVHASSPTTVRMTDALDLIIIPTITQTNSRIPPAAIARVVNAHIGQFRACYDHGRANNPTLSGRVSTRFVIDASGAVSQATSDPSTTLPDAEVVACVVSTFKSLKFPQPHGGDVTVTYPFDFHDH